MINVLLVDDHDLVRAGIRRLLRDIRGIRVVAEARSGEEALDLVRDSPPDVVLMDVNMPGIGGLEATKKIVRAYNDVRVIILTVNTDAPFPTRLLQAGAVGYLTKGCSVDEVVSAIHRVHEGGRYVSPAIAESVTLAIMPGGNRSRLDDLSDREMQVLIMLADGRKPREIAADLSLSPKTVSTYRYRIYDKLGVGNEAEMTRFAIRHGLVQEGQ